MLIDLYERPNTPQALKSRAFIDKVFSISGPDGGVVGGEDGVTTQRPLKDGGREAWDMMRRLREKAWQKAGLDPQQLWTEQAQIQAGVLSDDNSRHRFSNRHSPVMNRSGYLPPRGKPDPHLMDFTSRFYDMTRAQTLPNPVVSSLRQESPRYSPTLPLPVSSMPPLRRSYPLPQPPQSYMAPSSTPPMTVPTFPSQTLDTTLSMSNLTAESLGDSHSQPFLQPSSSAPPPLVATPTSNSSFPLDSVSQADPTAMAPMSPSAPTPPSMVDPNLNFDWDQWDAVFGLQLPVADELMELDPVEGLGLPDLGMVFGLGGSDPPRYGQFSSEAGSDNGMTG